MGKKILYWIPRLLAIAIILLYAVFAIDVYGDNTGKELFIALFIHLLPCLIMLAVLGLAWVKGIQGGILYILLGIVSIFFFSTWKNIITFIFLSVPLIIIGILFIVEHVKAVPKPYKKK